MIVKKRYVVLAVVASYIAGYKLGSKISEALDGFTYNINKRIEEKRGMDIG